MEGNFHLQRPEIREASYENQDISTGKNEPEYAQEDTECQILQPALVQHYHSAESNLHL